MIFSGEKKRLAWLVALSLMSGGVAQAQQGEPAPFQIRDARPPAELRSRTVSHLITGCNFGIQIFGDLGAGEQSPRLVRLREQIEGRIGDNLAGYELIVNRYQVSVYGGRSTEIAAISAALGGAGGAAIAGSVSREGRSPRCSHEKMQAGWFDPADLEHPVSPIVVEIDATLEGITYHVDAAWSDVRAFVNVKPSEPDERDRMMYAALDKANMRLIDRIEAAVVAQIEEDQQ
jgi:hypothetical protein